MDMASLAPTVEATSIDDYEAKLKKERAWA